MSLAEEPAPLRLRGKTTDYCFPVQYHRDPVCGAACRTAPNIVPSGPYP